MLWHLQGSSAGVRDILFIVPEWRLKGTQKQRNIKVQNGQLRLPPNEMGQRSSPSRTAVVPITSTQVQVPPGSLDGDSVEDLMTLPLENLPDPVASRQAQGCPESSPEASRQWLKPDIHTKEQNMEMLEQEPFQAVLSEQLRDWAQSSQSGVRIIG
ncbi:hypothetical protein J0S82_020304 [Galemys pyrenaicus]|uniref:SCAN box domain-containing protein n=1 Tax=Galemys pyrenaicus TaxID=202257 RepID=A0A8J6AQX7_GALPY|nr:hypothetical protein J0S82_020304 [Galemys pyrenaicus]